MPKAPLNHQVSFLCPSQWADIIASKPEHSWAKHVCGWSQAVSRFDQGIIDPHAVFFLAFFQFNAAG